MTVRTATGDDAAALASLVVQLGYPSSTADAERRLAQLVDESGQILVAVDGGVVGFIHVRVGRSLEHDPRAEICGLAVDESHRSRGIGRELVEAAEEWARQRGLQRIRVRSNVKRERARTFYERHGYRVTKAQNVFDKDL